VKSGGLLGLVAWIVLGGGVGPVAADTSAATARAVPSPASVFAYPATPARLAAITRPAATALANARVVRGKFVQRRYLSGLAKPLESSGSFLFAREAGIEWHTEKPHDFELYGKAGEPGWQLGLKPRAEALGSMFRQALVEGSGAVHRVTLEDGNGDRSEIEFQGVIFDERGLTPDERRRF
jgi:hypothetical protein